MKHRAHAKQRGIALFVSIFALLLLSAVAAGLMFLADTETNINNNYRVTQQASAAAWGGLQEVRERMLTLNAPPHAITTAAAPLLPTTAPNAAVAGSVLYVINAMPGDTVPVPSNAGNKYFDNELCHENFAGLGLANPGSGIPCATAPAGGTATTNSDNPFAGTNGTPVYKWVRINWKVNDSLAPAGLPANSYYVNGTNAAGTLQTPICWDGSKEIMKPAGIATCETPDVGSFSKPMRTTVYQLTSLAVTPTNARRMAQMEVALDPPLITNAALDTNDFVNVSGSSVTVNGYDNCACACTVAKGGAAPTCTLRTTGAACTGNTYAIFTSQTISTSGNPAIVAGTNPPTAEGQTLPYDVPALINTYKNAPGAVDTSGPPYNMSCTGSPVNCGSTSTGSFGTAPNPFPPTDPSNPVGAVNQITYIPGNVSLQAHTQGAGIMIVDGDLTVNGGIDFYGLILVKGVLTFKGGGAGQANNIIGGVLAGNGSVADALAGSINMQFDSCALAQNQLKRPPQMLSYRELQY